MSGARAHQTELETDTDMALDMDEHPEGASPTPQGSVGRFGQKTERQGKMSRNSSKSGLCAKQGIQ